MKKSQRIKIIFGILESVDESVKAYEAAEKSEGCKPMAGYGGLKREDSARSILRRCILARQELLRVMTDLTGE